MTAHASPDSLDPVRLGPGGRRAAGGLVDRLAAAIEAVGSRRVALEVLWRCFVEAEPAFVTSVDKRSRLAAALDELAGSGRIRLPGPRSFDGGVPPLPRSILVAARPRGPATASPARTFPWRPELSWAAEPRLRPEQFAALRSVNAFLRDGGGSRPDVPARERSLEIFGDEKALDALAATALFGPGRLSWELLRCHPVHPPFVWREIGPAPSLLVVENHHTYESLSQTLPVEGPIGFLGYGAGNHFVASVASAADLPRRVRRIAYFGDLDTRGLAIPIRASGVAAGLGLPAVEPAGGLYRLLLDHGRPAPSGATTAPAQAVRLAAWLPADLRRQAAALLEQGLRIAQEWVGMELLARDRSWLLTS